MWFLIVAGWFLFRATGYLWWWDSGHEDADILYSIYMVGAFIVLGLNRIMEQVERR